MKYVVLNILKKSKRYISGEEISSQLGITRAMVWKHIKELKSEGYNIFAVTKKGYFLNSSDSVLNVNEVGKSILNGKLIFIKEVGSTNTYLKELAQKEILSEGTCVFCDNQLKGRGRMGREWISSDSKNIAMSILLKPKISISEVAGFSLLIGICVYEVLKKYINKGLRIKWPNDILVNDKKICGILIDLVSEIERVEYIIVGIGINVHGSKEQLSEKLKDIATTLEIEGNGKEIKRVDLIKEILEKIECEYIKNTTGITEESIIKWKKYSGSLGKMIEYSIDSMKKTGEIIDVDKTGALIVKAENEKIKLHSGMIVEIEGYKRRSI